MTLAISIPQITTRPDTDSAINQAFLTVSKQGPVRLAGIVQATGLRELDAQRALNTLQTQKFITKTKDGYRIVR